MVKIFKNMFKSNKQQALEIEPVQRDETPSEATSKNEPATEKKAKHGDDGGCCGGCS